METEKFIKFMLLGCFILLGLIGVVGALIGAFLHTLPADYSLSIHTDNNTLGILKETHKIINLTQSGRSFNDFPKGVYNVSREIMCKVEVFEETISEFNTLEIYVFPCYSKETVEDNSNCDETGCLKIPQEVKIS